MVVAHEVHVLARSLLCRFDSNSNDFWLLQLCDSYYLHDFFLCGCVLFIFSCNSYIYVIMVLYATNIYLIILLFCLFVEVLINEGGSSTVQAYGLPARVLGGLFVTLDLRL